MVSAFGSHLQWPEITTVDYVSPVYESLDSSADLAGLSPILGDRSVFTPGFPDLEMIWRNTEETKNINKEFILRDATSCFMKNGHFHE